MEKNLIRIILFFQDNFRKEFRKIMSCSLSQTRAMVNSDSLLTESQSKQAKSSIAPRSSLSSKRNTNNRLDIANRGSIYKNNKEIDLKNLIEENPNYPQVDTKIQENKLVENTIS